MTQTTIQKLLKYPHAAVFDKDPVRDLAFRLRHPSRASWRVADGVLTAYIANVEAGTFALKDFTVAQLSTALHGAGFEILDLNSSVSGMSALVLVEASGDEYESNGDRLFAFTSLLWVLLSGYSVELREQSRQIGQALRQMIITQAEGEWLRVWGTLFGVGDEIGESDADYAARIPREAFRERVNAYAIEKAIRDLTGFDVRIEEPWRNIFRLDESLLSGPHRFYDGERTGYHLIQPVSRQTVDWSVVLPIVERNKAGGVIVIGPQIWRGSAISVDPPILQVCATSRRSVLDRYDDRALLDYGPMEDVSILNNPSRHRREVLEPGSHIIVPPMTWEGISWPADATWTAQYYVSFKHSRDYRIYYSTWSYGMNWTSLRTWTSIGSSWADAGPLVTGAHTRS